MTSSAIFPPQSPAAAPRQGAAPTHRSPAFVITLAAMLVLLATRAGRGQLPNIFAAEEEPAPTELSEPGLFFPSDRSRERELDRARRLIADQRWSDAAVALDELLAGDQDAFVVAGSGATRDSIRSAAAAAVADLPRAGRDAYRRLFEGRAAKQLAAAIAADDEDEVVAVARRWLHTPAGRRAALLAGLRLLESGQHLAAGAWLDRLARLEGAAEFEPTLSVMRAVAASRAGDEQTAGVLLAAAAGRGPSDVRLAGRDRALPLQADAAATWLGESVGVVGGEQRASGPDWRQLGGGPARNGVTDASRPLLVARYRVPLVRHPDEARRLEQARLAAADSGQPLLPAGAPLAVGDRLIVQTPLGILAIDFESGRRVWLGAAVTAAAAESPGDALAELVPVEPRTGHRAFDDATSGNLASDGRLVFAVESPPATLAQGRVSDAGIMQGFARDGEIAIGNTLSAYAVADGAVRWRLPAGGPRDRREDDAPRWHLGVPLVVGDDLFVLVEERGEIAVENRGAADGRLRWSQPLASCEEGESIASPDAYPRRLAGLTPAFDQGILVCPLGSGSVVAVDVAMRSLLWAHAYPTRELAEAEPDSRRGGEPAPVIAGGRVILAPFDCDQIICLDLRDGRPTWRHPRPPGTRLVGVTGGRLLTVGDTTAEAIDVAAGRSLWKCGLGDAVRPSGSSLLTPRSVLVPCDAPAVIEIAVADGRIVGRSSGRGGRIPGNLIAHRGELISRTADAVEVFHQKAVLEERIETARKADPASAWATYWQAQSAIDAGDVVPGLQALAVAARGFRIPPGDLDDALVTAMRQDFPAAARAWTAFPGPAVEGRATPVGGEPVARMAVDGFLAAGDAASAWNHLRPLLDSWPDPAESEEAFADTSDRRLMITADRWLQGRLVRLAAAADATLRRMIDDACTRLVQDAAATAGESLRLRRLEVACERLGLHPAADLARAELAAIGRRGAGGRQAEVRAALARLGGPARTEPTPADEAAGGTVADTETGWPLGQVDVRRGQGRGPDGIAARVQLVPIALAGAGGPGTRAAQAVVDGERGRVVINDDYGRPVTDPLPVEGLGMGLGMGIFQPPALELAVVGRALVVRSVTGLVAYDLEAEPESGRGLWRRPDFGVELNDRARWGGARDGAVPLGLRIIEPDDRPRGGGRGMFATPLGVFIPGASSITMLDPATGRLLWERHRLPPGLEWFVDGEFLCGCTADGRGSIVCQATDGRLLHTTDVPHRRQRVAGKGRRFVAVRPLDEHPAGPVADRVRLELIDPVDREARPIGDFGGDSRATATADGRLAVLEPGGQFSVFDLVDGSLAFRTTLAEAPRRVDRMQVTVWQDRYLVFAGVADDDPDAEVAPLEQFLHAGGAGGAGAPLSGAVWAIDAVRGRTLWPVPAFVERHCLHPAQPAGLPILTFCRLLERREGGKQALSVLCLDKRTGHAVFESDRVATSTTISFGCDLAGDPRSATIALGDERPLELVFTGRPLAPRPPFRSRARPQALGADELAGDQPDGDRP